jgi:hypothetical protein
VYGLSIIDVLQEIGMKGMAVLLDGQPPEQVGVMYCGRGTDEDILLSKVLMEAGVVTVGNVNGKWGDDKDGNEIVLPYCPPGSLFVGLRPPLAKIRSHGLKEMQKQQQNKTNTPGE